jgi:AmmeMemoRadiSam system protein A
VTPLEPADRAALLGIARAAVLHHLGLVPAPATPTAGRLGEKRGAFVTLHVTGDLRGCIGTFAAQAPLSETVARMAVAAAAEDPRFEPVSARDVPELHVGISALELPHRLADPRTVQVGKHGLIVKQGWARGALLPKVAVENGWDAESFLRHTCLKAGIHPGAWKEPDCEVQAFEADEFEEEPRR